MSVEVRDEEWLITKAEKSVDGWRLDVRGTSEYVRDTTAVFFTALDEVTPFDPADVEVTPDLTSPNFRRSRLYVETALRQTPAPLYQKSLTVATQMMADPTRSTTSSLP